MIPPFDERGNLPPGIHRGSWSELEGRLGGSPWRNALLLGLRDAIESLRQAGCNTAYLNGSFASAKPAPADFDACWEPAGVDFDALDPILLDFSEGCRAQKERFRGELFPADMVVGSAAICTLDFFQRERDSDIVKGIVEISLETNR